MISLLCKSEPLSVATAPAYYVDAMYKDLPGAIFDGKTGYTVPCNSKVNISMVFG